MEVKLFEVRDRATFIPCFGILMSPSDENFIGARSDRSEEERYLLQRAGFGFDNPLVMFGRLEGGGCQYDPYGWPSSSRTIHVAHVHIANHWNELSSGDVIDVEYILGETTEPKRSER